MIHRTSREVCRPGVVLQRADDIGSGTDATGQTLQILTGSLPASGCALATPKTKASPIGSPSNKRYSILCLSGQVELELDGQNYCLDPGDSLAFNSDAFHRWRNTGAATGVAVLIIPNE